MNRPIKSLTVSAILSALVMIGGMMNVDRLESKLEVLEAQCQKMNEEDKSEIAEISDIVCDPKDLENTRAEGVQGEISNAYRWKKYSEEWAYILAAAILFLGAMPLLWYFILGRVRELSNAIRGH